MGFGGKIHDGMATLHGLSHDRPIGNVSLNKDAIFALEDGRQIVEVASVGKLIKNNYFIFRIF